MSESQQQLSEREPPCEQYLCIECPFFNGRETMQINGKDVEYRVCTHDGIVKSPDAVHRYIVQKEL
jgi:hypothetical protein